MRRSLLSLLLLTISFGFSLAQAGPNKDELFRRMYNQISGRAETLTRYQDGKILVGVQVKQKTEDSENFCRKTTPVYPGAASSYSCFGTYLDGDEAREAYESSANAALQVLFSIDGVTRVGGAWNEKIVDTQDTHPALLCVKTHAVVPNPVSTYRCFHSLLPVGGGASIGN